MCESCLSAWKRGMEVGVKMQAKTALDMLSPLGFDFARWWQQYCHFPAGLRMESVILVCSKRAGPHQSNSWRRGRALPSCISLWKDCLVEGGASSDTKLGISCWSPWLFRKQWSCCSALLHTAHQQVLEDAGEAAFRLKEWRPRGSASGTKPNLPLRNLCRMWQRM